MTPPSNPRVAIALGDPAGIGPEIALKTALDDSVRAICDPILFGDPGVLVEHARACGLEESLHRLVLVARHQLAPGELAIGKIAAAHGRAALDSAHAAIAAALAGEVDAVIAAPQTEAAIKAAGAEFDGYPSFVARCTGVAAEDAFLMLCFDDVCIVHVTLHVSLRHALELVTRERVQRAICAADTALRRIGILAPRLAVAGVNPHASEGGLFGTEEAEVIAPAIAAARAAGTRVEGPFGADTMFHKAGYDAFVVMYHDQGHIAAKIRAFDRTAGMTIGTPIVFSSVAHGSALDIAGQNRANHRAMVEAVRRVVGARR
ncbi:MAG TPA: 4-hydroxythreonine-4-phosphate dehydrogenase PdxA [Burkholderiales bacterium]|nr:4-hydroxythreonine-4-phosphate dehydrogenase PdxA [Burkholderiales bacterium]